MIWNYLKNFELQKGVKLIGYSDIVLQISGVIVYGMVLVTQSEDFYKSLSDHDFAWNISVCLNTSWNSQLRTNGSSCFFWPDIAGVSTSAGGMLIHIIELCIAFGLIKGVEMRNDRKCNSWIMMSTILTLLESGTLAGHLSIETNKLLMSYSIPSIIYKFASCGIVKSYVSEVRRMNHQKEETITNKNDEDDDDDQAPILT